jgi:hypothetical protein
MALLLNALVNEVYECFYEIYFNRNGRDGFTQWAQLWHLLRRLAVAVNLYLG